MERSTRGNAAPGATEGCTAREPGGGAQGGEGSRAPAGRSAPLPEALPPPPSGAPARPTCGAGRRLLRMLRARWGCCGRAHGLQLPAREGKGRFLGGAGARRQRPRQGREERSGPCCLAGPVASLVELPPGAPLGPSCSRRAAGREGPSEAAWALRQHEPCPNRSVHPSSEPSTRLPCTLGQHRPGPQSPASLANTNPEMHLGFHTGIPGLGSRLPTLLGALGASWPQKT